MYVNEAHAKLIQYLKLRRAFAESLQICSQCQESSKFWAFRASVSITRWIGSFSPTAPRMHGWTYDHVALHALSITLCAIPAPLVLIKKNVTNCFLYSKNEFRVFDAKIDENVNYPIANLTNKPHISYRKANINSKGEINAREVLLDNNLEEKRKKCTWTQALDLKSFG